MFGNILFVSILVGILGCSFGIDIKDVEEGPCSVPPPTDVDADLSSWLGEKWYMPLLSKYELYKNNWDLVGKDDKDITEKDLKETCFVGAMSLAESGLSYHAKSRSGRSAIYDLMGLPDKSMIFRVRGTFAWHQGWAMKAGKDYFLLETCWSTGQKSFSVISRNKELKPEDKEEILNWLVANGFNSDYVVEYSYDGCPNDDGISLNKYDEL